MDANRTLPAADLSGIDTMSFEQQLQGQAEFIGIVYGGVFVVGLCLLIAFTLRIQNRPLSWLEPLRVLGERPWNTNTAAWIVLPLILIQVTFAFILYMWSDVVAFEEGEMEKVLLIVQSLLFHWVCFGLIAWSLHARNIRWSDAFGIRSHGISREIFCGVLVIVGVMPMILGYNMVARLIMDWFNYAPEVQDVTRIISATSGWPAKAYFAALAIVVAPVVEELLFRGILLPAISRLTGVRAAILIVSVLFAIVHGSYLPQTVIFFILSMAFSLAYIYRRSIIAPIAMHAFFNSLTVAVILRM